MKMKRKKLVNGMNSAELEVATAFPMLRRIPSGQSPREIQIMIAVNHNPDFALFDPASGKGIWVEVKGRTRNPNWFPMMQNMPMWMRKVYKVVLVSTNKEERRKQRARLDKLGIEWYDDTVDVRWIKQAAALFTGEEVLDMEE